MKPPCTATIIPILSYSSSFLVLFTIVYHFVTSKQVTIYVVWLCMMFYVSLRSLGVVHLRVRWRHGQTNRLSSKVTISFDRGTIDTLYDLWAWFTNLVRLSRRSFLLQIGQLFDTRLILVLVFNLNALLGAF